MKTLLFAALFTLLSQTTFAELLFSFRPASEFEAKEQPARFVIKEESRSKIPEKFWFLNTAEDFVVLKEWLRSSDVRDKIALSLDKDGSKYSKNEIDLLISVVAVMDRK